MQHNGLKDNNDFHRITSPMLEKFGPTATTVWKGLVKQSDRFISTSTERLFGEFVESTECPEMNTWRDYIYEQYGWVIDNMA